MPKPEQLRIATWNIGGGRRINSHDTFDYAEHEDEDYIAGELRKVAPDIVCLQESVRSSNVTLSQDLAANLGLGYVYETLNSPSHIAPGAEMTTATLLRSKPNSVTAFPLPYPTFPLALPSGQPAARWDKYIQIPELHGLIIANIFCQPMGCLGTEYDTPNGRRYAQSVETMLLSHLRRPLVLAGDLNFTAASSVYPKLVDILELRDALPYQPTKPQGGHMDYILRSPEITVKSSGVITTQTDHYLAWAEIKPEAARPMS